MASHGGAGQWHGAAHVPVHIAQRDIKEFGCPGARDGTLGERPQAQAFKTSGPLRGHGVRFLVRRRAPACALERVEEPVVQGLAEDAEVATTIRERLEEGSAVFVQRVEPEAAPDVKERLHALQQDNPPDDAAKAFVALNRYLADDNATGILQEGGGADVIRFPGGEEPAPVTFDQRAAVELATMTREALREGDLRAGTQATRAKLEFDRQIIAIARTQSKTTIHSDDEDISTLAEPLGLEVIPAHALPVPPKDAQGNLELDPEDES